MKNRPIKSFFKNLKNKPLYEFYLNYKNRYTGKYIKFSSNGNKEFYGQCYENNWVGIWRGYDCVQRMAYIYTRKNVRSGIDIKFCYEK